MTLTSANNAEGGLTESSAGPLRPAGDAALWTAEDTPTLSCFTGRASTCRSLSRLGLVSVEEQELNKGRERRTRAPGGGRLVGGIPSQSSVKKTIVPREAWTFFV